MPPAYPYLWVERQRVWWVEGPGADQSLCLGHAAELLVELLTAGRREELLTAARARHAVWVEREREARERRELVRLDREAFDRSG